MDFKIINKTPLYNAFSEIGKRIFLPDGIFYWSGRAKKEAELIGTIGAAFGYEDDFIDGGSREWLPCYLEDIKNYIKNLNVKDVTSYATIAGLEEVRNYWKKWIIKKSLYAEKDDGDKIKNIDKYSTTPIITSGLTNGIYISCALFLNPNEYIISPNKRWGNYDNIISRYLGAKIKSYEFFEDGKINIDGLRNAIKEVSKTQNKIVLILNFPNNPTGYVPTTEEVKIIVNTLNNAQQQEGKPIIVLIDDAYEPYVFKEDVLKKSIFYDILELKSDVIPVKIDGVSKELLLYGARIGFITIGLKQSWISNDEELNLLKKEINNKLEGIIRSTISNSNHFYQSLIQKIFESKGMDEIIATRWKVKELLENRYVKINQELRKIKDERISIDPNSGGFFIFLNLNKDFVKATDFADHLLKNYKVGVIPIEKEEEGVNGIRIAYCSIDIQNIPEIINRIQLALKDF